RESLSLMKRLLLGVLLHFLIPAAPPSSDQWLWVGKVRSRCLVKQLERVEASVVELKRNLDYAASVLEALCIEEARREISLLLFSKVEEHVEKWPNANVCPKKPTCGAEESTKELFKFLLHNVASLIPYSRQLLVSYTKDGRPEGKPVVNSCLHVDMWSFDVFALNDASGDHALKCVFYELFTRYDLINRFKVPVCVLISFVDSLEVGYSKHKNPYHNLTHAADVTQTIHYLLLKTAMVVRSGLGKS
uniref:PDEase domain-containing protein n=1 Tax=Gasterosteus aculeatus TaxID=69293 RepID=G3N7Q3_GASAC